MKAFEHTITDALGIHARPAGLLAKTAQDFPGTVVTVQRGDAEARATQLIRLLSLGIRQGDRVRIIAEGGDEAAAIAALEAFFRDNL